MYTVKEVCELTGMSYPTLKYYCNQGLIPDVSRDGANHRLFSRENVIWIHALLQLRSFHKSIEEMREFARLCQQGESAVPAKLKMLEAREEELLRQQEALNEAMKNLKQCEKEYRDLLQGNIPESFTLFRDLCAEKAEEDDGVQKETIPENQN